MSNKEVIVSPQFTLQVRDFVKGLIVSVGTSVVFVLQETIESGSLVFDWKKIGMIALGSALVYLSKNFFAKPQVTTVYNSNAKAKEVAEDIKK
jgi:hypothetical protein